MCRNGYYGKLWASLMHREMIDWLEQNKISQSDVQQTETISDKENVVVLDSQYSSVFNIVQSSKYCSPSDITNHTTNMDLTVAKSTLVATSRTSITKNLMSADNKVFEKEDGITESSSDTTSLECQAKATSHSGNPETSPECQAEATSHSGNPETRTECQAEATSHSGNPETSPECQAEATSHSGNPETSPECQAEATSHSGNPETSTECQAEGTSLFGIESLGSKVRRLVYDVYPKVNLII